MVSYCKFSLSGTNLLILNLNYNSKLYWICFSLLNWPQAAQAAGSWNQKKRNFVCKNYKCKFDKVSFIFQMFIRVDFNWSIKRWRPRRTLTSNKPHQGVTSPKEASASTASSLHTQVKDWLFLLRGWLGFGISTIEKYYSFVANMFSSKHSVWGLHLI